MSRDLSLSFTQPPLLSRIRIASGALDGLGVFTARCTLARQVALVTDSHVGPLYGARAERSLKRAGLTVTQIQVPAGERAKCEAQLFRLWHAFAAAGLSRAGAVVALGGGVVGDLAGFAAATWLRGLPWIGVPTSLLAQVDSSVGGKTAIDLPAGKNLVGAFHQPAGVLVDPDTLATLPARHVRAGLAEVIKMGMGVDAALFRWCEAQADALAAGDPDALHGAVTRSIRAKARIVKGDEREREGGARAALNLGHTLGHALEAVHGYRGMLHGEAVALGLRAAADLSVREVGLPIGSRVRLEAMLDHVGLPLRMPDTRLSALLAAMQHDKKRSRATVRWVLTPSIGAASVPRAVKSTFVRAALMQLGARG
ncbi:MAG: 3-dehydroquinate synthase [Candidatus Eisenbacteria bacterium]